MAVVTLQPFRLRVRHRLHLFRPRLHCLPPRSVRRPRLDGHVAPPRRGQLCAPLLFERGHARAKGIRNARAGQRVEAGLYIGRQLGARGRRGVGVRGRRCGSVGGRRGRGLAHGRHLLGQGLEAPPVLGDGALLQRLYARVRHRHALAVVGQLVAHPLAQLSHLGLAALRRGGHLRDRTLHLRAHPGLNLPHALVQVPARRCRRRVHGRPQLGFESRQPFRLDLLPRSGVPRLALACLRVPRGRTLLAPRQLCPELRGRLG